MAQTCPRPGLSTALDHPDCRCSRPAGRSPKALDKRKFDKVLGQFGANLVRYGIITVVVVGCLGVFGIETASFAVVLGAAGLAIGLAFQGTLSNFSAGVMLVIFRPFKIGDVVEVGGKVGAVQEIDLFSTTILTPDARRIIIPNSKVFGEVIENYTYEPQRRVDIGVGVAYAADVDRAWDVLKATAPTIDGVQKDPAPQIFLKELGSSSVDFVIRVWCKTEDYWDVHQRTVRGAKKALDEAGIGIPFPQMDVHLDRAALDALKGKSAA